MIKQVLNLAMSAALFLAIGLAQPAPAVTGNGLYAAPSTLAYRQLTAVAGTIFDEIQKDKTEKTKGLPLVVYDPQVFGNLAYYSSAVAQFEAQYKTLQELVATDHPPGVKMALAPVALSDLVSVVQLFIPSYTIQGQAVKYENDALVAAFAARAAPGNVTIPAYLLPAPLINIENKNKDEQCGTIARFVQAWSCAAYAASNLARAIDAYQKWLSAPANPAVEVRPLEECPRPLVNPAACKVRIQKEIDTRSKALEAYTKTREVYLAADKPPSMFSRLLLAESLLSALGNEARVIDLRLDGTGFDSTIRTILFFKSTKISANALAHYYLFDWERVDGSSPSFKLKLSQSNLVTAVCLRQKETVVENPGAGK